MDYTSVSAAPLNFDATLYEGNPVSCASGSSYVTSAVFRLSNGTLRLYPTPTIATSWDPNWGTAFNAIDYSNLTRGPDMPLKPSSGQAVACSNGNPFNPGTITRYDGAGVLNAYINPIIAGEWDPNWGNAVNMDCTGFQAGPAMIVQNVQQMKLKNGQAIQCSGNGPTGFVKANVSRFSNGFLREYPSAAIATSWDPTWGTTLQMVDCTGLTAGPAMALKTRAAF